MFGSRWMMRAGVVLGLVLSMGACAGNSSLGSVLDGALGGQSSGQIDGTVTRMNLRNNRLVVQMSNGQSAKFTFDNSTQVTYQNRAYPISSVQRGDQVRVRTQATGNGDYYVDYIEVLSSAYNGGTTQGYPNNGVQQFQGTVQQVNVRSGYFTVDMGNRNSYNVSMPYNPSGYDNHKFQSLRPGDFVRFTGTSTANGQITLVQFN